MEEEIIFGYPVKSSKELGLDNYFKNQGKNVAGMAWGGGENGSDPKSERVIVKNPYWSGDKNQIQGLFANEAARHFMGEIGYKPKFSLTDMQQEWRKDKGQYATNDLAAKQTIIGRIIGGEQDNISPTEEQIKEADIILNLLKSRQSPVGAKKVIGDTLKAISEQ